MQEHRGLDLVRQDDAGTVFDGNCYKTTKVGSYGAQCFPVTDDPSTLGGVLRTDNVLTAYEKGILYDGTYYPSLLPISLADNADNSATISTADGYSTNVTLQGRTLYKDGSWNTLCLPFSVADFNGTPLQGATVKTLASTAFSGGTLTMNFTDDVSSIVAGKPYIVKWAAGTDIVNPVFTGVTISNATANVKTDYADFVGTYSPVSIYTAGKTNLYLGAGNTLYYPDVEGFQVNAFRGYFQLKQGLTAGEASPNPSEGGGNPVRAFVLNFGDGEGNDINASGIITTNFTNSTNSDNAWYTLDGRKLGGKPTQRGIYVNNGRKIIIK